MPLISYNIATVRIVSEAQKSKPYTHIGTYLTFQAVSKLLIRTDFG